MKRNIFLGIFCILSLLHSGCSRHSSNVSMIANEDGIEEVVESNQEYLIQPRDLLEIKVYPDESFDCELEVSTRGTIRMPLIGTVEAEGMTTTELENKLVELLQKDYLQNPEVYVTIKLYHEVSVSILGEVNKPGPLRFRPESGPPSLIEAIVQAGGFTPVANVKKIRVIRTVQGVRKVYRVNGENVIQGRQKDILLEANDIIVIEESWF